MAYILCYIVVSQTVDSMLHIILIQSFSSIPLRSPITFSVFFIDNVNEVLYADELLKNATAIEHSL